MTDDVEEAAESPANIADLSEKRLAPLKPLEATFTDALADLRTVTEENGPVADEFRRYKWNRTTAASTNEDFEVDEILERNGQAAEDAIEAAFQTMRTAQLELAAQIAMMVAGSLFSEGDEIRSPYADAPMVVASIYRAPDASLSEVTFTTDGDPIIKDLHSWEMIEGQPQPDGVVHAHYERWSLNGVRVRGTFHPVSRRLIDIE